MEAGGRRASPERLTGLVLALGALSLRPQRRSSRGAEKCPDESSAHVVSGKAGENRASDASHALAAHRKAEQKQDQLKLAA